MKSWLLLAYWVMGSWMLSIALLSALKLMYLWVTNVLATKFYFSWFASLCSDWDQCLHTPYSIIWLDVLGSSDNKHLLTHPRCVVAGHVYNWTAHHQTQSKEVTNHGTNHESHATVFPLFQWLWCVQWCWVHFILHSFDLFWSFSNILIIQVTHFCN